MNGKVFLIFGQNTQLNSLLTESLSKQGAKVIQITDDENVLSVIFKNDKVIQGGKFDGKSEFDILSMVTTIYDYYGSVDYIIHTNKEEFHKSFIDIDNYTWDEIFEVNLKRFFFIIRSITALMIENGKNGRIINISSTSGMIPRINMSCLAPSLAGQMFLCCSLALELAKFNITINNLCINTKEMYDSFVNNEIRYNKMLTQFVSIPDIIDAIGFLLSDAGYSITGKNILLDGGELIGGYNH
jgi:NAD(P)-dependent dehydrogenase (short-subunit alcohol dehydrogenase family)